MDRAVALALARAPELGAARQAEEVAAARVSQARSAYFPRLSAQASYSAHWPKNELPIDLSALPVKLTIGEIDDIHRAQAGAGVALRLLDFSRGGRIEAARQSLRAEGARTRETEAALAYQVRATFLAALFARDAARIGGESLKLASEEEKRARLRAEVGTGSQVALAQARVRVATLRAQHRQAENELDRYRRQLASLLGLSEPPGVQGELSALAGAGEKRSLDASPTLERLRAARLAAEEASRSTARSFLPTLSLMARADYEYPHAMKLEWGPLVQGGATLAWDFFDGGLRRHQVRESRAQAKSLEELERSTEEGLKRKLIDLEARARTAQADLTSAEDTLHETEIYLRVARAALAAGTGTDLDVHNAELGADRARIAAQQALLAQALVEAERLMVHGVAEERTGGTP
jgi:outer membrane protein